MKNLMTFILNFSKCKVLCWLYNIIQKNLGFAIQETSFVIEKVKII